MVHHRFNWKRYQCFVQMVCHKAGPPPSWVPAFAGKTREGCGNDGGGRWYTTDSTGNGTSASSRWFVTRPGLPHLLGSRLRGKDERGDAGMTEEGDGAPQIQLETVPVLRPGGLSQGRAPHLLGSRLRGKDERGDAGMTEEGDGTPQIQLETVPDRFVQGFLTRPGPPPPALRTNESNGIRQAAERSCNVAGKTREGMRE